MCNADVRIYYESDASLASGPQLLLIEEFAVSVDGLTTIPIQLPWTVIDNKTTLSIEIVNSNPIEFNYDDNEASLQIGAMQLTFTSTPACAGGEDGILHADVYGGQSPYT